MNNQPVPDATADTGRLPPAEPADLDRLAALGRGDRTVVEEFYREMFEPVYAFVFWRVGGVQADAEDVTQETFVTALSQIRRFEGRSSLYTWVCGIARNLASERTRALSRGRGRGGAEGEAAVALAGADAGAPDLQLERAQSDSLVGQALTELPPHYQRALLDKYVRHLSFAEMATDQGASAKAVESTVQRAKRALVEALARRGVGADRGGGSDG